jgi:hypothetical protein
MIKYVLSVFICWFLCTCKYSSMKGFWTYICVCVCVCVYIWNIYVCVYMSIYINRYTYTYMFNILSLWNFYTCIETNKWMVIKLILSHITIHWHVTIAVSDNSFTRYTILCILIGLYLHMCFIYYRVYINYIQLRSNLNALNFIFFCNDNVFWILCLLFCTVQSNVIIQNKPTKWTYSKFIF